MKLCRYNDNKLGIVENEQLIDVTEAIEVVPEARWPRPHGDGLIANLATLRVDHIRTELDWNDVGLINYLDEMGFAPAQRVVLRRDLTGERTSRPD